ncbi:AfsR/SARP family transcriptional regulator [Actinoplanes rectilineatus]|uniref:AfsR/SARP family transcriptional regulator n=1 Tax=Actinoplanes rectilineatus TaxID=113571 RepID=UPI000695BFE2|nr:BTAD domain-containing putative transcriptional regulator [Actinoplanes rectilineatus]
MQSDVAIEVGVLGPVTVRVGGVPVLVGGRRQQAVLAMLVAARGRVVPVDRIVDQLWAGDPPPRAVVSLQAYVSRWRRLLEPRRAPRAAAEVLVSEAGGYALRLDDAAVDAWRFEQDLRRVEEMRPQGLSPAAAETALGILYTAMRRWRGRAYEAFADEPWAQPAIARLAESRRVGQERIIVSLLVAGRPGEAVPAAQALATAEPLRGQAWRLLAVALWAGHRSADALDALRRHRRHLADELGLEPEPALADLERAVLEQRTGELAEELTFGVGPAVTVAAPPGGAAGPVGGVAAPPGGAAVPGGAAAGPSGTGTSTAGNHRLPRVPAGFAAREDELGELSRHVEGADSGGLTVISGIGGVGKTTLAVRWAHQAAGRFPDGILYADLRGHGPEEAPAAPADVLLGFLSALGVPDHRVPPGESDRVSLFRSVLAGRRMLLLLDNARDADQVRPLFPGTPGCAVVVTSRSRLTGLVVSDGAYAVRLDGFRDEQARDYLRDRLGATLVDADPAARDAIVARCGGLPLALAMVCARAAGHSGFPLSAVAAELAGEQGLDAFQDLRTVFSWSYRRLPGEAALLFRQLALHPGPDVTLAAAVSICGWDRPAARSWLRMLCDAHLLVERRPGRYAYHDLIRSYAAGLGRRFDGAGAREDVLRRLAEHYLLSGHDAIRVLTGEPPGRTGASAGAGAGAQRSGMPSPPPGIRPERFADRAAAVAWLDGEHENITAVAELCRQDWGRDYRQPLLRVLGVDR